MVVSYLGIKIPFGKHLRELMRQNGWRTTELAANMGVSYSTAWRFCQIEGLEDLCLMRFETMRKIVDFAKRYFDQEGSDEDV